MEPIRFVASYSATFDVAFETFVRYQSLPAAAIHGDKEQRQRDKTLHDFRSGRCNILIATDVAQRGLDIKGVAYVVNYDVPKTLEDYIHRIGRTGRQRLSEKSS